MEHTNKISHFINDISFVSVSVFLPNNSRFETDSIQRFHCSYSTEISVVVIVMCVEQIVRKNRSTVFLVFFGSIFCIDCIQPEQ